MCCMFIFVLKESLVPRGRCPAPSGGRLWRRCHHSVCLLGGLHLPRTEGLGKCPCRFKSEIKTRKEGFVHFSKKNNGNMGMGIFEEQDDTA